MTQDDESAEVDLLTDELFTEIQRAQGFAFFSDGETFRTKAEFFERVRGRLEWQKRGLVIMTRFLKRHGELKSLQAGEKP